MSFQLFLIYFYFCILNFYPSFWQLGCHNSFFFFSPPIFGNLVATIPIFSLLTPLPFWQLDCHYWFLSAASPGTHLAAGISLSVRAEKFTLLRTEPHQLCLIYGAVWIRLKLASGICVSSFFFFFHFTRFVERRGQITL